MKCEREIMRLYAITDRTWARKQAGYVSNEKEKHYKEQTDHILKKQIESALKGGITCLQLREKNLDRNDFLKEALEIKELCAAYHVPLIINDDAKIAKECGANGVHVGQKDKNAREVRSFLGENMIIGVSARTVEQAQKAEKDGADYLGVGAAFPTDTKSDAKCISHETIREIAGAVSIPIVAIGGITKQNLLQLSRTGADGVALISAIFSAENIERECRMLLKLSEKMVNA